MEDEEDVERSLEGRARPVLPLPDAEEHVQEIRGIGEFVLGKHGGKPPVMPIGEGRERRHLRHQSDDVIPATLLVADGLRVGIEGGEPPDRRDHHPHRVRIVAEAAHQRHEVLVDVGMTGHHADEAVQLGLRRQLAPEDEVGHLEKRALLRELLDRVPAVAEDPLGAVNLRHRTPGGDGVRECRIIRHHPKLVRIDLDLAQVHGPDDVSFEDVDLVLLTRAVVSDRQTLPGPAPCHVLLPLASRTARGSRPGPVKIDSFVPRPRPRQSCRGAGP